jgi:hypothetical protein
MNIKPVYLAVRNVRHILKNHQIISQIVIVNPHTKHDKLGYHPIHYTHDADYQIQSRNKIELRQQSSRLTVIYLCLAYFVI